MKRLAVLLLAIASLATVAAACGGGGGGGGGSTLSKEDYEAEMQSLGDDLSAAADSLGNLNPTDIDSATEVFDQATDLYDKAANGLSEIEAPDEIADAHAKLIAGLQKGSDEFKDLADQVENATLADVPELLQNLNLANLVGIKQIQEAIAEIKAKGYDLGSAG